MNLRLAPPALIICTDKLPEGVGGMARGPVVFIRPEYQTDVGLEEHELEHVRQWWITLGAHSILYPLCRAYRAWSETAAYKMQTQFPDRKGHFMTQSEAAVNLCWDRYDLGWTLAEAYAAVVAQ